MHIISISRGSQSFGSGFARQLAAKLGYECISREDLLEEATKQGIPVGKLETAIIKPHLLSERLASELEHYKALATSILCEKALDHDIVYHGRTGHLLLPGIDNILRIRVVSDMEQRIDSVMSRLNLPRKKAQQYIDAVEEDRRRWVKKFYNVNWDEYTLYDLILNLSHVETANAAMAVCSMVQLPEFQSTPASVAALKNSLLAAKARLLLARDDRTHELNVKITANRDVVYVTYSFLQSRHMSEICEVLKGLPDGIRVVCTEAQTSLLWIQEKFDVNDSACDQILSLANAWDAAVEVIKVTPGKDLVALPVNKEIAKRGLESWRQTGIIDESEEHRMSEPEDVVAVYEHLINRGRAGGKRVIEGSLKTLVNAIDRSVQYRMIVLDNMFLDKSAEARKRSIQEWSNTLSETLSTPVVTVREIQERYQFGVKQAVRMAVAAAITALILYAVFTYDDQVMAFLGREGTVDKIIATICVVVFVPTFAFVYSTVTGLFLRMIRLD